jgi:hypothetical protein
MCQSNWWHPQPAAGGLLCCTMLSTSHALKEWDSVPKVLAEVKAYAAAHPEQPTLPADLESQLEKSADALLKQLASPHATWKQLLKKKVSPARLDGIAGWGSSQPLAHRSVLLSVLRTALLSLHHIPLLGGWSTGLTDLGTTPESPFLRCGAKLDW